MKEQKLYLIQQRIGKDNIHRQCEAIGKCEEAFEYGVSRNMQTRDVGRFLQRINHLNLENLQKVILTNSFPREPDTVQRRDLPSFTICRS